MRTKYNVDTDTSARSCDGIVFDSAGEMRMYRDCLLPQLKSGKISSIERQVPFVLVDGFEHDGKRVRPVMYNADFVVTFACGRVIAFDYKGMVTPEAVIKRKLFWSRYPGLPFHWVTYSRVDGGWVPLEYARHQRKLRARARKDKDKEKANGRDMDLDA